MKIIGATSLHDVVIMSMRSVFHVSVIVKILSFKSIIFLSIFPILRNGKTGPN